MQSAEHAALIPTKLFDYLATGNPVVVLSPHASASWDVASRFGRCQRLDLEPTEHNRDVMTNLVAQWRSDSLIQERSVEDTEALTKPAVGAEFTRLIEDLVAQRATC
jgi:hypothetical protein